MPSTIAAAIAPTGGFGGGWRIVHWPCLAHGGRISAVPLHFCGPSGRPVPQPPHAKALVAPAAAGLQAILVEQFNRRSPIERRAFEVQRAPVAVLAVGVALPLRKRGRDQPYRAGRPKIRHRAIDIGKRQMHEAVAAQDGVATRQRVRRDIGEMVFALDVTRGGAALQAVRSAHGTMSIPT